MSPTGVEQDRELVDRFLRTRDESTFVTLYRAHTPMLYRMAWRAGSVSAADADDLIQEVWVRATRRLSTFRFESALRTWLVSILFHCLQEHRRRANGTDEPVPDYGAATSPDLAVDLERAVASLSNGQREVFLLHDVEGFTHEEIGECCGISTGTSKSQLSAARQRLRRWLGSTTHET